MRARKDVIPRLERRILSHPLLRSVAGTTPHDFLTVVTSLTLGLLVFHGFHHDYFEIPFQLLFVAFLVAPRLRTYAPFWFLIACFSATAVWLDWREADNHKYLLFYWTVAVFLACELGGEEGHVLVKKAARFLLLFTMTLAVVQKSLSPNYLSGDFFQFILMIDGRFSEFTALLCGIDLEVLDVNRELYWQAQDPVNLNSTFPPLFSNEKLVLLAHIMTWLDYLTEVAIAGLVLLPGSIRWSTIVHVFLIGFISVVYAVAPVIGFGWLLTIWGYCLAPDESARFGSIMSLSFCFCVCMSSRG